MNYNCSRIHILYINWDVFLAKILCIAQQLSSVANDSRSVGLKIYI